MHINPTLAKTVLDACDHSLLKLLITWFSKDQRSNCSCTFLIWDHLDPLIESKKGFDCLIQFWSWLQTLLHDTSQQVTIPCTCNSKLHLYFHMLHEITAWCLQVHFKTCLMFRGTEKNKTPRTESRVPGMTYQYSASELPVWHIQYTSGLVPSNRWLSTFLYLASEIKYLIISS